MSPDLALEAVGRAMNSMADGAKAAAAAQDILGRGTGKLANALRDLAGQGLENVKEGMEAAGRVTTDELIKKLAEANPQLEVLDSKWTVVKGHFAEAMLNLNATLHGDVLGLNASNAAADAARRKATEDKFSALGNPPTLAQAAKNRAELEKMLAELNAQQKRAEELGHLSFSPEESQFKRVRDALEQLAVTEAKLQVVPDQTASAALAAKLPELQKAFDAARFDNAPDEMKLQLLDQQVQATMELFNKQSEMAQHAKDDVALKAAQLGYEGQMEALSAKRRDITEKIAADEKRVADEKKRASDQADKDDEDYFAREAKRIQLAQKETEERARQALADKIAADSARLSDLDDNKLIIRQERDAKKVEILHEQNAAIAEQIRQLKELNALNPDPTRESQISGLQGQITGNDSSIRRLTPLGTDDSVQAVLVGQMDKVGSAAENAASIVRDTLGAAVDGLSGSMQGLINGTMTWGDALRNIGATITGSVVKAISDMFAQWVVGRASAALANISWTQAEAAVEYAAKLPGALLTSISSFGVAPLVGLAALTAVLATAKGFADGGLVRGAGDGRSDSIPAWLSHGEYVIPANSVAQYGTGFLDAVRDGRVAPVAPAAGGGGQGGTDRVLAPAVLNSENEFRRFMESHKGRAIVLNHLDGAGRLMLGGRA